MKRSLTAFVFFIVTVPLLTPSRPTQAADNPSLVRQMQDNHRTALDQSVAGFKANLTWLENLTKTQEAWFDEQTKEDAKLSTPEERQVWQSYVEAEKAKRGQIYRQLTKIFIKQLNDRVAELKQWRQERLRTIQTFYQGGLLGTAPRVEAPQWGSWRNGARQADDVVRMEERRRQNFIQLSSLPPVPEDVANDLLIKHSEDLVFMSVARVGTPLTQAETTAVLKSAQMLVINQPDGALSGDQFGQLFYQKQLLLFTFHRGFRKDEPKTEFIKEVKEGKTVEKTIDRTPPRMDDTAQQELREHLKKRVAAALYYRPERRKRFAEIAKLRDDLKRDLGRTGPELPIYFLAGPPIPPPPEEASAFPFRIEDKFGRNISKSGVPMIDCEGHVANRIFIFFLRPLAEARFADELNLTANEARLHFDLPSEAGSRGPRKTFSLRDYALDGEKMRLPVRLALFPDFDEKNEVHQLRLETTGGLSEVLSVPIYVTDQDKPERETSRSFPSVPKHPSATTVPEERPRSPGFPIASSAPAMENKPTDFSRDLSNFFFDRSSGLPIEPRASVVFKARDVFNYFIESLPFDPIKLGEEVIDLPTRMRSNGTFDTFIQVKNEFPFSDQLLFVVGHNHFSQGAFAGPNRIGKTLCSRGEPSALKRSAYIVVDGVHGERGYSMEMDPQKWFETKFTDTKKPMNLFLTILHELQHTVAFTKWNPYVELWYSKNRVLDAYVEDYQRGAVYMDAGYHLMNQIDHASQLEAFGTPGRTRFNEGMWQLQMLDLLAMEGAGLKITSIACMRPFSLIRENLSLAAARVGSPYHQTLGAKDGAPTYFWKVEAGALPEGIKVDSYTGTLWGSPTRAGEYIFLLSVADQDDAYVPMAFSLAAD